MPDNRLPDNRLTMANAHVQTWEKPADGPPKITRTHPVSGAFPEASPEAVKIRLLATWLSDQIEQIRRQCRGGSSKGKSQTTRRRYSGG